MALPRNFNLSFLLLQYTFLLFSFYAIGASSQATDIGSTFPGRNAVFGTSTWTGTRTGIVTETGTGTGIVTGTGPAPISTADSAEQEDPYIRSWKSSPQERGTSDLLLSCFVAIGLAIWSSVTLNVQETPSATKKEIALHHLYPKKKEDEGETAADNPQPSRAQADIDGDQIEEIPTLGTSHKTPKAEETEKATEKEKREKPGIMDKLRSKWHSIRLHIDPKHWVRWKYKILWAFVNVMVPELVLIISLDEYATASAILSIFQKKNSKYPEEEIKACKDIFKAWDRSMGFYAATGGFYVPDPHNEPEYIGPQSLVQRCCAVTETRVKNRVTTYKEAKKAKKVAKEAKKSGGYKKSCWCKKSKPEPKPKYVLTAHGVVYIAKLVDKLQACKPEGDKKTGSHCKLPVQDLEQHRPEKYCTCAADAERLCAQFKDISPEIIEDLSKGDWLGHIFFFVQAIWMIIQCTARYYSNLTLTLLELHAATHVGLAIVHYFVWWQKPTDITVMTPLSLTEKQLKDMQNDPTPDRTNIIRLPKSYLEIFGKVNTTSSNDKDLESGKDNTNQQASSTDKNLESENCNYPNHKQGPHGFRNFWHDLLDVNEIDNKNSFYFTSQATLGKSGYKKLTGHHGMWGRKAFIKGMFTMVTMFEFSLHRWPLGFLLWMTMALFYSGINLCAWNWYFPTRIEQILWRLCAAGTTVGLVLGALGVLIPVSYIWLRKSAFEYRVGEKRKSFFIDLWWRMWAKLVLAEWQLALFRFSLAYLTIGWWFGVLLWLLGKLFIAAESLLSLREIPRDTYTVVKWTTFIPHL